MDILVCLNLREFLILEKLHFKITFVGTYCYTNKDFEHTGSFVKINKFKLDRI